MAGCGIFETTPSSSSKQPPIGEYNEAVATSLRGYWQGTYIAGQGKTAALMNLKTIDENGIIDGDFIFQHGEIKGSYKMRGVINFNNHTVDFSGVSWYVQPKNSYNFLTLTASLSLDQTTLTSRSTNYSLNVVKQTASFPDKGHVANLLQTDWNGTYIQSRGMSNLRLEIQSVDVETGNVGAIFHFDFAEDAAVGSYRMSGNFDFETHVLLLKGIEWISRPTNYVMLDFFVILNQSRTRLLGDEANYTITVDRAL